jgi:hypothetical protein
MPQVTPCRRCGSDSPTAICERCRRGEERNKGRRRTSNAFYLTPRWRRLAKRVTRRDGKCAGCTSTRRLTAAHIIPRADGGLDTERNLFTLCGSCHSRWEADTRHGRHTEHRQQIDTIRKLLIHHRSLCPEANDRSN